MPRKPFFRKHDGWWYIQLRQGNRRFLKKLVKGKQNVQEAYRLFNQIIAEGTENIPPPTRVRVHDVLRAFLEYSSEQNTQATFEWYKMFLVNFGDHYGSLKPLEVTPEIVDAWLRTNGWGGGKRSAVIALKRAFSWAFENDKIMSNPLRKVKKPPAKARDRFLSPDERRMIYESYKDGDPFRDFLFALEQTGCRPGEVASVNAQNVHLQLGVWILDEHKTRSKTGEPRVIILTPQMIELSQQLMNNYPDGPLFRNEDGNPWNRNSIRCRFRRVREKLKLGNDVVAYLYRHAFATDALENGAGIADVCELLGHKSTDMVMKHYSKLRQRREHLREQVIKATRRDS